ncbi:hypothetical protein VI817_005593 [Penicillium citrinum]|nr:hypothetical protein VI817_005593 [Penicillium citrinum]
MNSTYFIPPKMSSKEIVVQKTTFDVVRLLPNIYMELLGHKSRGAGYKYPQTGQIVISHDDSVQSQLSFEITCGGNWFCDAACSGVTSGMIEKGSATGIAPVEVFGTVHAGICALC